MPPATLPSTDDLPILPPMADGTLCVGYSGGLDSTVLLHRLAADADLRQRGLRALHVHHGLHADADAWAGHCHAVCAALGVELIVLRVTVDRDGGHGPEDSAREARLTAFDSACVRGEIIALAQHRDDQAETVLLRALRGSGVDGLAAMRSWRRRAGGWLWRPLLEQPRAALLAYAQRHTLHWIDDPSNADASLDRNYLRHRVMPLLQARWPQASAAFARVATLAGDTSDLLADDDAKALHAARTTDPAVLHVPTLMGLDRRRRSRVLRAWIAARGLPSLPATGVTHIERDLLDARHDACPAFAWRHVLVRRWRDLLHAGRAGMTLALADDVQWDGRRPLPLPTGDRLSLIAAAPTIAVDAIAFDQPLSVRARQGGERIVLPGRPHSHALKDVLLQHDLPPWLRERLPLLVDGRGNVLAAGDAIVSASLSRWLADRGLMLQMHAGQTA